MRVRRRLVYATVALFVLVPTLYTSFRVNQQAIHAAVSIDTEERFLKLIVRSGESWLVEFFDPKCSSCQAFRPVWKELTSRPWAHQLRFATVSVGTNAGMELAKHLGILTQGLPNVQLFLSADESDDEGADEDGGLDEAGARSDSDAAPENNRGGARRKPKQFAVMGGADVGMSAVHVQQRVLQIIHDAQLEKLGLADADGSDGDDDDDDAENDDERGGAGTTDDGADDDANTRHDGPDVVTAAASDDLEGDV